MPMINVWPQQRTLSDHRRQIGSITPFFIKQDAFRAIGSAGARLG
jgi:hypothetical protein